MKRTITLFIAGILFTCGAFAQDSSKMAPKSGMPAKKMADGGTMKDSAMGKDKMANMPMKEPMMKKDSSAMKVDSTK